MPGRESEDAHGTAAAEQLAHPAGYFTDYLAAIDDFSAGARRAVFLPFAAVALPWRDYAGKVSEAIGLELHPVEELERWIHRRRRRYVPAAA